MLEEILQHPTDNVGMVEEIMGHMMGHKLKDRVRDTYLLADPDDLRKSYLRHT